MSESRTLSDKAVAVSRPGKLPSRRPDRMWGGMGTGARCGICGALVGPRETELEIEFDLTDGDVRTVVVHRAHPACFTVWESELQQNSAKGHAVASRVALSGTVEDARIASRERSEEPSPRVRS